MSKDDQVRDNLRQDEELVPVPVPALVAVLLRAEQDKGLPLTEGEVNEIRDKAVCIMMPISVRDRMAESRGYADLDPEYAWTQWQLAREELSGRA